MNAICLLAAGALHAALPADDFTLAWTHSVQRTRWEERYHVDANALVLTEARVQSSGAGMEPGADAVLRNGWWVWHPQLRLPQLVLAVSGFTADYSLCRGEQCAPLRTLLGAAEEGAPVTVRPCTPPAGG